MVEQNAHAALVCDYAYLMEAGSIVLSGRGRELIDDKHIREAYPAD
jgi:branched-chain amino acid transport system ATP-binding protein